MTNAFVIGLMSGTSLDGLDLCLVEFSETNGAYHYKVHAAETLSYSQEWLERLKRAERCHGAELMELHAAYGKFLGEAARDFQSKQTMKADFAASHGHTIFHVPAAGYTFQLGSGAALAAESCLPVVCDFRSTDVALGGQGAPLVPVGDALLFPDFTSCLNLGGFANISFDTNDRRIAFDICPVNYVLNRLAQRAGKPFDENGAMAASGKIIPDVLQKLNALSFYTQSPPKSLGREWVEQFIFPLLENEKTEDLLRTFSEHAAMQIAAVVPAGGKMLVTGGGAHNAFFIQLLKEKCKTEIVIPDKRTIDFKEALVFAFLGWLRWNNTINVRASVTGAQKDSCSGSIYLP